MIKRRNVAFQLALKQCCKTSCTLVLPILPGVAYVKMIILLLDLLWTKQEIWVIDSFHVAPNIQIEQTETDSFI